MNIPDDLVHLDSHPYFFTKTQLNEINKIDWFAIGNLIFVSYSDLLKAMGGLLPPCESSPESIKLSSKSALKINDCLKRWNGVDGFYHA